MGSSPSSPGERGGEQTHARFSSLLETDTETVEKKYITPITLHTHHPHHRPIMNHITLSPSDIKKIQGKVITLDFLPFERLDGCQFLILYSPLETHDVSLDGCKILLPK